MKKLKFIVLIMSLFVLFPVVVSAYGDPAEAPDDSEEVISARMERIKQTRKSFPIRLSEKEQTRLAARCAKAQTRLGITLDTLNHRSTSITKRYDLIELHLAAIQKRLISQQIDTSIIDLLITNFMKLTTLYDIALLDYQTALSDASSVDCTSEPETFKALLENVRAKRQVFVNSVEDIKDFTKGDLKTSFDALRARLKSRSDEL